MLAQAFCAASPDDQPTATLEAALVAAVDGCRQAWPHIEVEPVVFVRHLATRRAGKEPPDMWLRSVRVTDLYLTCACMAGAAGAVEAFERDYMPLVDKYLRRDRPQPSTLDDLRQRVREKLLVGARKIGDYSGRGTLATWLEVVTVRVAIDLARQRREVLADGTADAVGGVSTDPELDYIKETYRAQFREALRKAVVGLDAEQRNLLRMHFLDGVTLDQLAGLFHVHRATIVRRLARAREAILDGARALIEVELHISPAEVDSLMRLVRSRLDLSLSGLLA